MVELLVETLETLGRPVYRQGSLAEKDDYPRSFYTFWNDAADGGMHYDDEEHATDWEFTVYHYSDNAEASTEQGLVEAREALRSVGFDISGKGYDVPSGEQTHTGRAMRVYYREMEA